MLMFEKGKLLIHDTVYVATYVKVKCIGEIIWKLMAKRGEGDLWANPPENVFADHALQTVGKRRKHLMSIYLYIYFFISNKYLQQQHQLQQCKLIKTCLQGSKYWLHYTTRRLTGRNRRRCDRAHLSCSQQKNIKLYKLTYI